MDHPIPSPSNLMPARPLSPLIGRASELLAVVSLILRSDVQLLSLTGPGGVGKTALAWHAARGTTDAFPDGTWFVSLAPITDPTLVVPTIMRALGIAHDTGATPGESLAMALAGKHLLLILDNFEQVATAAFRVVELLQACPAVTVLVTSRVRLRVSGEHEYNVPPMELPAAGSVDLDSIANVEAVRLFVASARTVQPDFALTPGNAPTVAEICRRLDGLPLAIELAVTRLKMLGVDELCSGLDRRLSLLRRGNLDLPARQQTMRATIGWSHDLLTPGEQEVFRRLAVFAGSFDLNAALAICDRADSDDLASLIDHSLVMRVSLQDSPSRYSMLQTIREYALENLVAHGEDAIIRNRHATWFLGVAERLRPAIEGPQGPETLARLELDHPNFRVALGTAIDQGDAVLGTRLAAALWKFWYVHWHIRDARRWLEAVLALPGEVPAGPRAEVLYAAASLANDRQDYRVGASLARECLALAEAASDPLRAGMARYALGTAARGQGRFDDAQAIWEAALSCVRETRPFAGFAEHMTGMILSSLGAMAYEGGNRARSRELNEEALAIWRRRDDPWGTAHALLNLAAVTSGSDAARASGLFREALARYRDLGDPAGFANALAGLAMVATGTGQAEVATRFLGAAEAVRAATGSPPSRMLEADCERALTSCHQALGPTRFAELWDEGAAWPADEAFTAVMGESLTGEPPARSHAPYGLSRRELEVLQLVTEGRTDQEIADRLSISYRTATTHVTRILNKLGVDSRTAAASLAVRERIV